MDSKTMDMTDQQTQTAEETHDQERKESMAVIDFKMVTFSLSGKDYAIDIMNVKEIAKAGRFTYVPNTLPFVLGVYNLRGEIIPILDMRLFFNIEVPERTDNKLENLIILTVGEQTFGVVVDKIDKVVGVQKSTIQPPHPLFGDINIKYISGVVEANKRLYILLDISRIFNSKIAAEEQEQKKVQASYTKQVLQTVADKRTLETETGAPAEAAAGDGQKQTEKKAADESFETNLKFVIESLKNYRKFNTTPLNETWVRGRFSEWFKERGESGTQLQKESDADEFLKPFWSADSGTWWAKEYAEALSKLLPDNTARQIIVWNPGCGKGMETYCLACVLTKRYPEAKIKVYAQDVDLLNVSNAPLLSVPDKEADGWLSPYLTKKADGEYTFTQDIKNSIMFEYHDCTNTNALPPVDIVFSRDVLSFFEESVQTAVLSDFAEKMKGNGLLVVGDNEIISGAAGFKEHTAGTLRAYTKQ